MFKKIELFLQGNKVFFLGLLGAIGMTVQQLMSTTSNNGVIIFAAVIAALSYASKFFTGKIASLIGVVGSAVGVISVTATGGHVDVRQLVLSTLASVILVLSGPAPAKPTTP